MQQLNRLLRVMNAASSVAEIVREKQSYRYGVRGSAILYLDTEDAEVRVYRWELPTIEIAAQLQASFAWRIAQEQDDAGVYFVARRRAVVGSLADGVFSLTVPHTVHLTLRLVRCQLWMNAASGVLEIPPQQTFTVPQIPPEV